MAKKKAVEKDVEFVKETIEKILVFKAKRPLTEAEHKQLSDKLRYEEEQSGVKIVLVPYSCEVE